MTGDEQDRIAGAMLRESKALKKTIACLQQKLEWVNRDLNEAANAVRHALQGNVVGRESGITYVSADDLVETLESLRDAQARLKELNQRLDAC